MNYKYFLLIFFLLTLTNCSNSNLSNQNLINKTYNSFINKGFTLIYSEQKYKNKQINKKIDSRSLIIFQKNLKKNTVVKVTNILNGKSIIAKVGNDAIYPSFNNSVISKRIADELKIDQKEPYIEIVSITENSSFVAKRAKTFNEEKQVANKAPVDDININDLNKLDKKVNVIRQKNFKYIIKIANFYYYKSALETVSRINNETNFKKTKIKKFSNTKYQVFLGPFENINSLQRSFNDIDILKFENVEFIKND